MKKSKAIILALILTLTFGLLAGCSSEEKTGQTEKKETPVLKIGAIPDQDVTKLAKSLDALADYLGQETGLKVEYVPSNDYAALVTAFQRGEVHLAWFGGLTGVQARALVPDAEAIAQRPRDQEFHSVFIAQANLPVEKLEDLKGKKFTFGSESSTSGHLMPRYFLMQEGIDPDKDFDGKPNFSGSHDTTYKLVESGAFQVGVLNEAVWESAVAEKKVDTTKVKVFNTSPAYFDYHWTINNIDSQFGAGTKNKIKEALLNIGPDQKEALEVFQTDSFIATKDDNYKAILEVAKKLGMVK